MSILSQRTIEFWSLVILVCARYSLMLKLEFSLYTSIESIDEFTAFELSRCWDAETNWEAIMWRRMRELFLIFHAIAHTALLLYTWNHFLRRHRNSFFMIDMAVHAIEHWSVSIHFSHTSSCMRDVFYFAIKNKRHTQSARATKKSRGVEEKWKVFFFEAYKRFNCCKSNDSCNTFEIQETLLCWSDRARAAKREMRKRAIID